MAIHVIPTVADARAAANAWLLDHLPDRFAAGIPVYDVCPSRKSEPVAVLDIACSCLHS
jgi:hypothetical protein